jgi:hypothetical protein
MNLQVNTDYEMSCIGIGGTTNETLTVLVDAPPLPIVTIDGTTLSQNFCAITGGGLVDFTYAGAGAQSAYELQIADNPAFSSPIFDTGSSVSYAGGNPGSMPVTGSFVAGEQYFVRAKAWDSLGTEGPWSSPSSSFRHPPNVAIGITPDPPFVDSPFIASDLTNYGLGSPVGRFWDMGDGTTFGTFPPPSGGGASVSHTYADTTANIITLTVEDSFGTACAGTFGVNVGNAIPFIKEVTPLDN